MTSHPDALLAAGFRRHASNSRMFTRPATARTPRLLAAVDPDRPLHLHLFAPAYQLPDNPTQWVPAENHTRPDTKLTPAALQQILRRLGVTTTQTT